MNEQKNYKVLNFESYPIAVHTAHRDYLIEGNTSGTPQFIFLSFEDIDYINSRSPVFRNGMLRFEDDVAEALQEQLRNFDWGSTFLTDEIIDDALLHPTKKKMERILAARDVSTAERYRGRLMALLEDGRYGVSPMVDDIVMTRYTEIISGVNGTKIELMDEYSAPDEGKTEEIETLKQQNEMLLSQMAEMQKQLAAIMEAKKEATPAVEEKVAPKKPATRKPKATTLKESTPEA